MAHWINGEQSARLSVADRAVQFGDGCFTTLKIDHKQPQCLTEHISRLRHDCQRLHISELDWSALERHILYVAALCNSENGVLKVMISRGEGGRGYSIQKMNSPTVIVSTTSYPAHYLPAKITGINLILSPVYLGKNALLAGIKHLNRLEQVLIKQQVDYHQADEAIVVDSDGFIVECCSANVFWRKGNTVYTPDLQYSGVAGIMRTKILEWLAHSQYQRQIVRCKLNALAECDEVLVCNSLMPLLPVNQIQFTLNEPQAWTYRSRELYHNLLPHCLALK